MITQWPLIHFDRTTSALDEAAGIRWLQFTVELAAGFLAAVLIPTLGGTLASNFFLLSHMFPHQSPNVGGGGSSSLLACSLFLPLASSPCPNL